MRDELNHIDVKQQHAKEKMKTVTRPMDLPFALLVVMLVSIGLVAMFSASYAVAERDWGNPLHYFLRQAMFAVAGVALMLFVSRFHHLAFKVLSIPAAATALTLLVLVLFIGKVSKGARRWIEMGPVNIQPSEVAKIAVILLFAAMITAHPEKITGTKLVQTLKGLAPYLSIMGIVVVLMMRQPHISGIIIIVGAGCVMLFLGGLRLRWIAAVGAVLALGLFIIINFTDYATARITIWQDPWSDPQGDGWQTIQSLLAIGSAGYFGLGLGQSRQKYTYLPEPQNDYVFSIWTEETGLVGALIVLFLFMLLIARGYWLALHAPDRFGALLVGGITTLLAIQTFLNVAVVTSLIPVTGISMPFFSYGGSALLIQMVEMGVILAVSRRIQ